MRILLTANASYVPPRGGSTRSNLVWLEYLASRGHDCRVVAPAILKDSEYKKERVRADLEDQEIRVTHVRTDPKLGFDVLKRGDITVYSVGQPDDLRAVLRHRILRFQPDWVLVSTEDLGQALLREALQAAPDRVVYLAHTPQMFPFGPASLNRNPAGKKLVLQSAGIVAIGEHTASYIEEHLGRRPDVIHPPVYGTPPFPARDPGSDGLITMINASAVKGISIFLELARRFPPVSIRRPARLGHNRTGLESAQQTSECADAPQGETHRADPHEDQNPAHAGVVARGLRAGGHGSDATGRAGAGQ